MKSIWNYIGKGFSLLFTSALLLWAATLTVKAVSAALPGDPVLPWLSLGLYDGGALAWMRIFLSEAKGTAQRSASISLMIVDLAGLIGMSAGGLKLIEPHMVTIILLVSTLANVAAWYFYKVNSPENREAIAAQDLEDMLAEQAEQQARASIEREAQRLGAILARRTSARIKVRMRLPMTEDEQSEWRGDSIDAETIEPALPAPAGQQHPPSFMDWLRGFFGQGATQPQQPAPIGTSSNTGSSSEASAEIEAVE